MDILVLALMFVVALTMTLLALELLGWIADKQP